MGAVPRRNKLLETVESRAESLEYAVHGKWRRERDTNGEHGCWHIGMYDLVEAFGGDAVRAKLAEYATAQAAAREDAIAAAAAAQEEEQEEEQEE